MFSILRMGGAELARYIPSTRKWRVVPMLFARGYCWADLVVWAQDPRYDFQDVSTQTQCGYCGACMEEFE
jgi:hypothetical protein